LRPANHPQRRLALVSKWAIQSRFIPALETWCAKKTPVTRLATSLQQTLQVEPDEFWSWHWTFRSARFTKAQPLIGLTRLTDLAVNVILPWLWIRGVEGKNPDIVAEIEQQYYSWPAAEDNSLLRLARQRLLGGLRKSFFKTASAQQGLIQIVRDFCEHSNAVCDQCKFPDLVREWNSVANKGLPCPSSLLEIQNSRVTRSSLNK
jgi:hypothetical protein